MGLISGYRIKEGKIMGSRKLYWVGHNLIEKKKWDFKVLIITILANFIGVFIGAGLAYHFDYTREKAKLDSFSIQRIHQMYLECIYNVFICLLKSNKGFNN